MREQINMEDFHIQQIPVPTVGTDLKIQVGLLHDRGMAVNDIAHNLWRSDRIDLATSKTLETPAFKQFERKIQSIVNAL